MNIFIFLFLTLVFHGVGLDPDEVKSVSVVEGENLTLHTDDVKQKDDTVIWYYKNPIGQEKDNTLRILNGEGGKVDDQTGSLTITNSTTEHSGLYTLKIRRNNKVIHKNFNVTVYTRLPVPDISRYSSQCSSSSERSSVSKCVLLCSVMNVRHVTLSWYNGSNIDSSISVSEQKSISLPLEVEQNNNNTYRCVLDHTKRNQTQHVNITHACQPCSDSHAWMPIIITTNLVICGICILFTFVYNYKRRPDVTVCMKARHTKVPLTDEKRNFKSTSVVEIAEELHTEGN